MVHRSKKTSLALEPRHALGVLGEGIEQHFDRDLPSELFVFRSINLTHPSFADWLDDLVVGEALSWGE